MLAKMRISRGPVTFEIESDDLRELEEAERWVYDLPRRTASYDEQDRIDNAQPGDTVKMRTR